MTLAEFHQEYGAEWYLFVSSPLWKAAKSTLTYSGPLKLLPSQSPETITAHGVAIAANLQGFLAAIADIEQTLVPPLPFNDITSEPASFGADETDS